MCTSRENVLPSVPKRPLQGIVPRTKIAGQNITTSHLAMLRAKLPAHDSKSLIRCLEGGADIVLTVSRRKKPVVVRVEVHSAPAALGAEDSAARELSLVRGERQERNRRRTALANLQPVTTRLPIEAVA